MTTVLQIFKSVRIFQKPDYTPETRKALGIWPDSIKSSSGYIKEGILFLPSSMDGKKGIEQAELLVLVDDIRPEQGFAFAEETQLYHFRQMKAPALTEIFMLKGMDSGGFEVFLDYTGMAITIGVPRREDHKIAELRPDKPVRYRINGKSDFTLSGRKQRHYHEFEYIMEFIGGYNKIEFLSPQDISCKKSIPVKQAKDIDERKAFY